MNSRSQYYMMAGDDMTIVNLQTQWLIVGNTSVNQTLLNTYVFSYHGTDVSGAHRHMSIMLNSAGALMSNGFNMNSSTIRNTHADLEPAATHINICVVYFHVGSDTQSDDQTQLVFQ